MYNEKRSIAPKTASTYVHAVWGFFKDNGVPLNMSGFGRGTFSATPEKANRTVKMNSSQVERLSYYAPTLRDKAIIWICYQTGIDISTVLSLNWGDIAEEFKKPPVTEIEVDGKKKVVKSVKIDVTREKTGGKPHRTYLFEKAIEMLRRYLVSEYGENFSEVLAWNDPLFVSRNDGVRFTVKGFQSTMREVAPKCGIVSKERLEHASNNPLSPRSLRASFSNSLKRAGCDPDYIDFWMGHTSRYGGAYSQAEREDYCRYAYMALEPKHITPEVQTEIRETGDKVNQLRKEIHELYKDKDTLRDENEQLKNRLEELAKRLKKYEPLEPLASRLEEKGGLPPHMIDNVLHNLIQLGEARMYFGKYPEFEGSAVVEPKFVKVKKKKT